VGDAANEDDLGRSAPARLDGLLGADVHLNVLAGGVDSLEAVVVVEAAQLEQVVEGRAHVPAEDGLLVAVALGEGVVERILLGDGDEGVDGPDAEHVELALFARDGRFDRGDVDGISGGAGDVQDVDRSVGAGGFVALEFGTEVVQDLGKLVGQAGHVRNDGHLSVAHDALALLDVGELEVPVAGETSIDVLHLDLVDAVGAVDPADVHLEGGAADGGVLVTEKGAQEVDSRGESGGLGQVGKVDVVVDELLLELGDADLEGRDLGHADERLGGEGQLAVLLALELGQLLQDGKEVFRERSLSEPIAERFDLTEHGEDELGADGQLLVGKDDVDDRLEAFLVGEDHLAHDVVLELAVELSLHSQE